MSPGNSSINNGDDISITLDVVGGVNVHRVLLGVTFNPVVVQAVDANAGAGGVQILSGAFPGTTVVGNVLQNDANNTTGTITYEYTLTNPSAQATGNGTVATVQFHAIAAGNANIQWTTGQFTDNASASSAAIIEHGGDADGRTGGRTLDAVADGDADATHRPSTDTPAATDTPVPGADRDGDADGTETADGETRRRRASPSPVPTPPPARRRRRRTRRRRRRRRGHRHRRLEQDEAAAVGRRPSGKSPALPSAGNNGPGIQWWRWIFFLAALMLAVAGWFFTFAIHYGDKEPILVDRGDRRRRRRY